MHKILITLTLILVFGTSAYMSIFGLAAVFTAAGITVIVMGAGMELGKILTVIHLHRRWNALHWLSRFFYMTVIIALVLITSCEILGYLSQHHVKGMRDLTSERVVLMALDQEETILRTRIEMIDNTLDGLPDSYVTKRIREKEVVGYGIMQLRLAEIIKEKAVIKKQCIRDRAYSAPIFAVARIFNIDETKTASLFIFFLVAVLEPLSIGLAVAVSAAWLPIKKPAKIKELAVPSSQKSAKTGNDMLRVIYSRHKLTAMDVARICGKSKVKTAESWLKNEARIPIKALRLLHKWAKNQPPMRLVSEE